MLIGKALVPCQADVFRQLQFHIISPTMSSCKGWINASNDIASGGNPYIDEAISIMAIGPVSAVNVLLPYETNDYKPVPKHNGILIFHGPRD